MLRARGEEPSARSQSFTSTSGLLVDSSTLPDRHGVGTDMQYATGVCLSTLRYGDVAHVQRSRLSRICSAIQE